MKAVVVSQNGGPERLELQEVPTPRAGAGQLRVAVRYTGINYADTLVRRGVIPSPEVPFIPGMEIVGTVDELGAGVEGFSLGQPVAAFSRHGYAQHAVVPAALAVPLDTEDARVDPQRAIGVPCTGVTAHQLLTRMGRLADGETVFVQGAAGGVGTMLGQQAKALGAGVVIGSVGDVSKRPFVLAHGYDAAFTYEQFPDAIAAHTHGRGVDLYLEGNSGAHLASLGQVLAPLGRAVYFGDAGFHSDTTVPIQRLRAGSWMVCGYSLGGLSVSAPGLWRPSALAVLGMIARGAIRDVAVSVFSPTQAGQAHAMLESRRSQGKLALDWGLL